MFLVWVYLKEFGIFLRWVDLTEVNVSEMGQSHRDWYVSEIG